MIRRGEVPFVAIRVGQSNDPREVLGLARELKISRATALGYIALWQELILEVGDALTGRVKGYNAQHLAAKLGHDGNPRKLVEALKRAGVLSTHKGTLRHPTWAETITGQYATRKAKDRETWRAEKDRQREAARAAALEAAGGPLGQEPGPDVHPESGRTTTGRPVGIRPENAQKERKESTRTPPQPPASRGERKGFARWEWVLANHQRPTNPQACLPLLEAMSEDDWALFQWVSTPPEGGGPRSSSRKKRVLELDTHQSLAKRAYLQFLPEWRAKLKAAAPPKNGASKPARSPAAEEAADGARRAAGALAFVLQQLEDEPSEAKREQIRARFAKLHPGVPLPWEQAEGAGGLQPSETTA